MGKPDRIMDHRKVILAILDGWGHSETDEHNAIRSAKTPFFDELWTACPHAVLEASGEAVGLPPGQIGNSEVGHMTIGAGAPPDSDLVRITKAIKLGELADNPALISVFEHVKKYNSTLHLQGMIGPGGVHSHQDHLHALIRAAKAAGLTKVAIHVFTDGRDLPPQSAHKFVKHLEDLIAEEGLGFIATATGRFYAMDRDNNWDRVAAAEQALFSCKGRRCRREKPSQVIEKLHKEGMLDEHLEPLVFLDDDGNGYPMQKNDAIVFFNFRPDRARQLSQKILEKKKKMNLCFATMTEYDKKFEEALVLFPDEPVVGTLAQAVSEAGLTQGHAAETEKYAHVTYFLNGGKETPFPGEERVLVESRRDVPTHDLAPEMKAKEVTDQAIKFMDAGLDFVVINYANADMVGHSGNVEPVLKAIETLDHQIKRLVEAAHEKGYLVAITADHGNAELNYNEAAGQKHTAHTTAPVPFLVTSKEINIRPTGTLADVAPTILDFYGLPKPKTMTGNSLIVVDN